MQKVLLCTSDLLQVALLSRNPVVEYKVCLDCRGCLGLILERMLEH